MSRWVVSAGWLVPTAWAHRPGLSYAQIEPGSVTLTFARPELAAQVPLATGLDGDLDASRVVLHELLLSGTPFSVAGTPCALGDLSLREVEGDGVALSLPLGCPPGDLTYIAGFLPKMEAGHRHYVEAGGAPVAMLDANHITATTAGTEATLGVALRFGGLGVEHIWTGTDHLLFLAGLLLAAPSLRAMLLIVTGFTVAHSITLSAAALGLVTLSPRLVEPAIAASIVYVGLENFWRPSPRRRVAVTFLLGLIHGFGFAGMLTELGLPRHALATALVCFNGGVELGQAAVVALLLPLLLWLRRFPWWERRAVPTASLGVAAMGLFWLVDRLR